MNELGAGSVDESCVNICQNTLEEGVIAATPEHIQQKSEGISSRSQLVDSARRIPELDGIRGIACLLVVTWHYFFATLTPEPDSRLAKLIPAIRLAGLSGVDLFFVLSGFLIGGILIDHRESPRYFRTFYTRRVFRIFPVYFFVYFTMLALLAFSIGERVPAYNSWLLAPLMPLWSYATFTQNYFMGLANTPGGRYMAMTWSVAVEEQFYLTFPLLVRFTSRRVLVFLSGGCIVLAFCARYYLQDHLWWAYTLLPCRCDGLAMGVLAACAVRNPKLVSFFQTRRKLFYLFFGVTLAGLSFTYDSRVLKYSLLAFFYGALILFVLLHKSSWMSRISRNAALRFVGLISYGLYMYHQPMSGLLNGALFNREPAIHGPLDFVFMASVLLFSLSVSALSYLLVEKRLMAIGRRARWT